MTKNTQPLALARSLLAAALVSVLIAACDESTITEPIETPEVHRRGQKAHPWRPLLKLARATAPFLDFEKAQDEGYNAQLTPCWFFTGEGAMGYHYGDPALIDGTVELTKPEALLYEPRRNGSMRFVAMEYLVPIDAWEDDEPPELLGQTFHRSDDLGVYLLHIWLWRNNPEGLFANWNPRVTCRFAEESEDRAPRS